MRNYTDEEKLIVDKLIKKIYSRLITYRSSKCKISGLEGSYETHKITVNIKTGGAPLRVILSKDRLMMTIGYPNYPRYSIEIFDKEAGKLILDVTLYKHIVSKEAYRSIISLFDEIVPAERDKYNQKKDEKYKSLLDLLTNEN